VLDVMRTLDTRPDLIHANFAMPDGVAAVRAGARANVPVVVTLLGSDFNRQMSRPLSGPFVARSIGRADAVIAVSRQIAEGLAAREPQLAHRIEFIPNGYNSELYHYEPKPAHGPFLFVGSFTPVKNPLVLVQAFGLIAPRTSRELVMIGRGHLQPEIERAITELGLTDRVRLPGRVTLEQLRSYFRDAGVFVLPSATEGMPLVVIESLATGTPVVGSAVGAIPDLVVPGVSGYLVEPGDVEDLAEALLKAEKTAWDNAAIAEGAPVIDWAENARRVMAVYRRVIDR
jgi:glycosyltransferase involved in cell wall biosynthesis